MDTNLPMILDTDTIEQEARKLRDYLYGYSTDSYWEAHKVFWVTDIEWLRERAGLLREHKVEVLAKKGKILNEVPVNKPIKRIFAPKVDKEEKMPLTNDDNGDSSDFVHVNPS